MSGLLLLAGTAAALWTVGNAAAWRILNAGPWSWRVVCGPRVYRDWLTLSGRQS